MNVGDLNKVWEIKALKRKPGEEEAMKMLEKIAKQVQPIMRKHKWRVKLLSEFWSFTIPSFLFFSFFFFCHAVRFLFVVPLMGSAEKNEAMKFRDRKVFNLE